MLRGYEIISLEGIDGGGKSTVISSLKEEFGCKIIVYKRTQKSQWLDKLLSSSYMKKHYMLQFPIYLLLSYINFYKMDKRDCRCIIMDRCFLSNLCYFFPKSINNIFLFEILMMIEIKIIPKKIFILDTDPVIGMERDKNKKLLGWLIKARECYLATNGSISLKDFNIEIIDKDKKIEEKTRIISDYLRSVI